MEDLARRLPGSPLAPPAPPAAPAFPAPTPTAQFFDAAPPSPWAPAEVPSAFAAPATPAFLGATPAPASPFTPPVQSPNLPAPTVPAPPALAPPVHAPTVPMSTVPQILSGPHAQHGGGPAPVAFAPIPAAKKSRGPVMVVAALIAVVAVGLGAFMMLRGGANERLTDDSTVVVPDPAPDDSADFSFSTATAQAQAAGSMMIEFSADTPEGPADGVILVDRASRRMSVELDLSQLETTDDGFIEPPDSYRLIVDQETATMYINSEVFGFFEVGTAWLSASTEQNEDEDEDENSDLGDDLDQIFANPFDIADVLVDADPIDLGVETIDGEELRRYRVTQNFDGLSSEDEPGAETSVDADEIEYDVWVTKDSEIRRIEYDFYDDGDELRFVMTVRASTEAVDIALPDPADVTDFDALFNMDAEVEFDVDATVDDESTTIDGGAADEPDDVVVVEAPEPDVPEIDAPSVTAEAVPPGHH